jgi:hypothetical protein
MPRPLDGEWPLSALWQVSHDWRPDAERDGSLKIFAPSDDWADRSASAGASADFEGASPPPHALNARTQTPTDSHCRRRMGNIEGMAVDGGAPQGAKARQRMVERTLMIM